MRMIRLLPGVMAAAAAACDGTSETSRVVVTDSAGIPIVTSPPTDVPLGWRFERVVAIGGDDDGPASFFRIPPDGLAFGADGEIVVLDAGNRQVKLFDAQGRHLRSMGRDGRGPGEFQFPASLVIRPDGAVTVLDPGPRAAPTFGRDGELTGEAGVPRGFFGGPVRADGDALIYGLRVLDPEVERYFHHVARAAGQDTLDMHVLELSPTRSILYEECGVSISLPPIFDVVPQWDALDGTLVLAARPAYEVRYHEGGELTGIVRRAVAPQTATPELARLELGEGEKWVIGGRECVVPPEVTIEKRGIASQVPVIEAVRLVPGGDLWVRRFAVGPAAGPIDVFNASGHYRGSLPSSAPWPAAFGPDDRVLVLEEDDLGAQTVVLYRLVRS